MKKINMVLTILLLLCTVGCEKNKEQMYKTGSVNDISDITYFDEYDKRNSNLRRNIDNVVAAYEEEIGILNKTNGKLNFENCKFQDLPQIEKINIYLQDNKNDKTYEEGLDYIKNILDSYNINSQRVLNKIKCDSNFADSEHFKPKADMSMKKEGISIKVEDVDIALCLFPQGLSGFSDDIIPTMVYEEIGDDSFNPYFCMYGMANNYCSLEKKGSFEELKDEKYQLYDGVYSVGEMYNKVEEFFNKGTPYVLQDVITEDIKEVNIWSLGDKYFYEFMMRRKFDGIPVDYMNVTSTFELLGDWGKGQNYEIIGDVRSVSSANCKGVNSFIGYYTDGSTVSRMMAFSEMIGLEQAVEILNNELSDDWKLNIDFVELCYEGLDVVVDNEITTYNSEKTDKYVTKLTYIPCWVFKGTEIGTNYGINLYVDVISGDVNGYMYE